jgi:opacity protein-like surface antigen
MKHQLAKIAAIICVSMLGMSQPTTAADFPQIINGSGESGGEWYLRLDGSASINSWIGAGQQGRLRAPCCGAMSNENTGNGFSAGAGVGLKFGDWLRADVTAEYRGNTSVSGSFNSGAGRESASIDGYIGFANGYIDFKKWDKVTPYLGGGIGAAYLRSGSVNKLGLAWNATVGTAYRISDNIELDINYRYTDLGTAQSPSSVSAGNNVSWDIVDHNIRAGVRIALR